MTTSAPSLKLKGFEIKRPIHEGHHFIVHRGRELASGAKVLIKTARPGNGHDSRLEERLQWEYEITRSLAIDGILAARKLIIREQSSALILGDQGTVPLSTALDHRPIDRDEFLHLSVQLTTILGAVHKNGVIHKAIHPQHIFVDSQLQKVGLSGFGIASRLPDDNRERRNTGLIPDMLRYLAPEQTGRMNRRVGFQTDFYAMGVVFYELLTGEVPFSSDDPLELVHAHIAREPIPPVAIRDDIPLMLSNIILKLLAKAAEDRYMSAQGLRCDLEACAANPDVPNFVPGARDNSDQIQIPEKLYGRETEVATLLGAFERVSAGTAEMLLVSGYSGVGKTALVCEVHKPIVRQRGYFIAGKFDQFKRNIPYSAVISAFRHLSLQLLAESEDSLSAWRALLGEALEDNGQVVSAVIPEIELIVGPLPPVPQLPPAEAQNRFNLVFERFLKVLTRVDHPLVVFLDDLQWADAATLDLLRRLADDPTLQYMLIIGAYRDNEVDAGHPLARALEGMQASAAPVSQIVLKPLGLQNLEQLVCDTLHCSTRRAAPLTSLVHEKTRGNPFFVIQFIKVLQSEGLLFFDYSNNRWAYEPEGIRKVGITANVVDLMVRKISGLPADTQEAVKLGACIGNVFDLETLAIVSQSPPLQVAAELLAAIQAGLVLPTSPQSHRLAEFTSIATETEAKLATYKFLHDRVQQAAYQLIPEQEKPPVHLSIGRLMWRHCDESTLDETLFEVAGHLNIGQALITDDEERIRLVELNLRAGHRAKTSTAFQPALNYFQEGVRRLPPQAWASHYQLAFELNLQRAECFYLCGHFEQAEKQLENLLVKARSPIEKGEIYRMRIVQYENTSRFPEARDWGKAGLALFDITFPQDAGQRRAMLVEQMQAIQNMTGDREIEALVDLPVMTDEAMRTSMRLLMTMWAPAYISGDMMLTGLIAARMVMLSLQYGNVEESAYGYVTYAATICLGAGDYRSGLAFGRLALKVNEHFDDLTARAKVNHMFSCYIGFWRRPLTTCLPYSQEAFRAGLSSGDFIYAAYGIYHETWHAFFGGRMLREYHDFYAPYLAFMTKSKNQTFFDAHQLMLHIGLALEGRTEAPWSLSSPEFDETQYVSAYSSLDFFMSFYYIVKLQLYYLFGQLDQAAKMAAIADKLAANTSGMIWDVWRCFYQALTIAARFESLTGDEQKAAGVTLRDCAARLATWAANCRENFEHCSALVAGEIAALEGDPAAAMSAYERAIEQSAVHGFVNIEALANESYAKFWIARGNEQVAAVYLQAAERCYSRWGATAKVDDLRTRYSHSPRQETGPSDSLVRVDNLDMAAVMRAAQVMSAEMERDRLISKLLRIVMENAGAEKGILLLERQHRLLIVAKGVAADDTPIEFPATTADSSADLAISVVNYVANSNDTLVLADAGSDSRFMTDAYIQAQTPLSVLCMPILHQGRAIGMIYLENNLVRDAFTSERVTVVGLLASQAAISLESARLYDEMRQEVHERKQAEAALRRAHDELEARVSERTDELSHANARLRAEVNERRQTAAQLKTAKEAAEAASAAKGEFLANMSHELRTPLNAILGYTQILQRGGELSESQRSGIVTIEHSGEHLLTLINDILSLSKAEAGKLEMTPTDFWLRDFLDDICDIARVRTEQKGLAFHHELLSRLPRSVHTDERSLRQVLLNLLSNATKFTNAGSVTLRVAYDVSTATSPQLVFEVADTGIGIDEESLEEIFEPFQQLHLVDRHEEGTGLGLAISRKLITLMGGSLKVHSEPGKGSTFRVELTVPEQAAAVAATSRRRITGFVGAPKRILVVDDKAKNRAVLVGLLAPLGFELAEAQDGRQALQVAESWQPHAILLDLVMPVMDGFETARTISRSATLNTIVVLALSASVFEHSKVESLAAGCKDFIVKPVNMELLLNKLREHLALTWTYATPRAGITPSDVQFTRRAKATTGFARPPSHVLRSLHQLAQMGDIQAIDQELQTLETQGEQLKPFVHELRRLARAYDMQQITEFVNPDRTVKREQPSD